MGCIHSRYKSKELHVSAGGGYERDTLDRDDQAHHLSIDHVHREIAGQHNYHSHWRKGKAAISMSH